MFPFLAESDPGEEFLASLAAMMMATAGKSRESFDLPAGYTYFGQFVDHDITFDPTSKLQRDNDPNALVDFRTPRLDLDSLYGSGPIDQPFLYNWEAERHPGVRLLLGRNPSGRGYATVDLPRNRQGRALIGDARNDENLIVSQLHLLFIRFHNRVVEWLDRRGISSTKLFEDAQRTVRWHYQWIVAHDFLPRIVESTDAEPGTADKRALVHREFFKWHDRPFMPVEFSAAAYRFGHSLVREDYVPNDTERSTPILRPRRVGGMALDGFRRLPARLRIDWKHFFPTTAQDPQHSMLIDPKLTPALSNLPPDGAALTSLNLHRGRALGLPAGPDVARAMSEIPLSEAALVDPLGDAVMDEHTRELLVEATPLWYYILCEALATSEGERLGPVGGRIVGEVLTGLLEGDPQSYVRQSPRWRPELPAATAGAFTMADLIRFTHSRSEPPPG
jgi:hypothetical protein